MGLQMIGKMERKIGIKMRRPSDAAPSPSLLRFLASEASRLREEVPGVRSCEFGVVSRESEESAFACISARPTF